MPRASQAPSESKLAKLLLIGDGKIGKTHFAGLAAEQGFNVLYLNGDVAGQTIDSLSDKAKQNIYLVNCGDRMSPGGGMSHDFVDFLVEFTSKIKVVWNDTDGRIATRAMDLTEKEVWEFKPSSLDANWVLVIDSWTSLVQSIMLWAANTNGVDLSEADSPKMRPVYAASGTKATQFLAIIRSLPCHVICIGHPDEYMKQSRPDGQKLKDIKETDMRVEWTKMVPKSTSKPHSLQMAKFFTDVAWMEASRDGKQRLLNFKLSPERICGGHFDDSKPMEEYSFANLVKRVGGRIPDGPGPLEPALLIHERGAYAAQSGAGKPLESSPKSAAPEAASTQLDSPPKPVGLMAMMAKKQG